MLRDPSDPVNLEADIRQRLADMDRRLFESLASLKSGGAAAIMPVLNRHTMLVAREAWYAGCRWVTPVSQMQAVARGYKQKAEALFPLPPKLVLREEPVPGTSTPLYRVREGMLEVAAAHDDDLVWLRVDTIWAPELDLMRHALDLHDRPYREVRDDGGDE